MFMVSVAPARNFYIMRFFSHDAKCEAQPEVPCSSDFALYLHCYLTYEHKSLGL